MDKLFRKLKKGAAEIQKARSTFERATAAAAPATGREQLDINLGITEAPAHVDEFLKLRDQFAGTPAGAAAIFLLAMHIYGEDRELGLQCLTIAVDAALLEKDSGGIGYKEKVLVRKERDRFEKVLTENPETARGYWNGATPDNGYQPETPFRATIYRQPGDAETVSQYSRATRGTAQPEQRLFIMSQGYQNSNESGRPIVLARNTSGVWKAKRYGGVVWPLMKELVVDDGDDL